MGEADVDWEALFVFLEGGRKGEMEGAFVEVDADAEAELDMFAHQFDHI